MAITTYSSKEEADAIPDPKKVVAYDGKFVVYTEEDVDTPPKNPAEGE